MPQNYIYTILNTNKLFGVCGYKFKSKDILKYFDKKSQLFLMGKKMRFYIYNERTPQKRIEL